MPRLEEVVYYLRGLWLILTGKDEGFQYLDFTDRGFWRSWWSLLYCLPPMLLNYAALHSYFESLQIPGLELGGGFYLKIAFVDLFGTIMGALLLFAAARLGGFSQFAAPIITAINWLGVPLLWAFSLENLIQLYVPGSEGFSGLVELIYLVLTIFLCSRIIGRIVGGNRLVTAVSVLTLYIVPMVSQYQLASLLALFPTS